MMSILAEMKCFGYKDLKVPYYTVFHKFHTAIRSPTTLYSKSRSSDLYWEQAVSVPAPLNANVRCLSTPTLPATRPSQEEDAAYASSSMR